MLNLASALPIPMASSATPGPLDPFWYNPIAPPTASGIVVKPDVALKVGAVFGCVRVLRESFGSLPWEVFDFVDDDTAVRDPKHYLWNILGKRPSRWQTAMEFKEMGVTHVCLRGNFYCRIVESNDPKYEFELWPLNPDRMQVDQLPDQTLRYTFSPKAGVKEVYSASEIFHVRGLTLNGITGVSVIEYASQTVGLSIAQQTHGASLFRNGGLPTFWIKRPAGAKWTKDAIRNFRSGWRKLHAGPENAGNPPILQDGMELHELGLTNRDTQWLESLNFNALDICRFFGVPPHMIGVQTDSTLDIEQLGIEFVRYSLRPLAVRFEEAAGRDLMLEDDGHFTRCDFDELERGSMMNRFSAYNIGIQGGWFLPNEARRCEGLNPIKGGDEPRFPMNMQPAGGSADWQQQGGQPGKGQKIKKKPAPEPDEDDDQPAVGKRQQAEADSMNEDSSQSKGIDNGGRKKLLAIWNPLLRDAACRIAAAEIRGLESRVDKADADRTKWNQWAEGFYAEHEKFAQKTLYPITLTFAASFGRAVEVGHIGRPIAGLSSMESIPAFVNYCAELIDTDDGRMTTRAHFLHVELIHAFFPILTPNS